MPSLLSKLCLHLVQLVQWTDGGCYTYAADRRYSQVVLDLHGQTRRLSHRLLYRQVATGDVVLDQQTGIVTLPPTALGQWVRVSARYVYDPAGGLVKLASVVRCEARWWYVRVLDCRAFLNRGYG